MLASMDGPARRSLRQSVVMMSASTSHLPVKAGRMLSVRSIAVPASSGAASSSFLPRLKHWRHDGASTSAGPIRYLHSAGVSSRGSSPVHQHDAASRHRRSLRQFRSEMAAHQATSTLQCTCRPAVSVHAVSPLMARHLAMAARRQAASADSLHNQGRADRSQSDTNSQAQEEPVDTDTSLTGKLKSLIRNYGWAAIVVYILFSFLDFGIIFFLINLIGADYVQRGVDYLLDALIYGFHVHDAAPGSEEEARYRQESNGMLSFLKSWREKHKATQAEHAQDAEKRSGAQSLWATAALAYGIHKTLLLPVRLGATAAATPAIVR